MSRRMDTRKFIENQLRVLSKSKRAAPTTRLRAVQTLIAFCGFPTVSPKDIEPDNPVTPSKSESPVDIKIQTMLDQNRKGGGADADKLS